jgi:hypothetical protein
VIYLRPADSTYGADLFYKEYMCLHNISKFGQSLFYMNGAGISAAFFVRFCFSFRLDLCNE